MSLLFLGLLPALAVFHLTMWFGFTRGLFRPETGGSKRMGYLVGLEDRQAAIEALEPKTGFQVLPLGKVPDPGNLRIVFFGDSFMPKVAKACSVRWHEPVGTLAVNFSQGNGLSQLMTWLQDGWFPQHGVKTIVLERIEYAWLDTFADPGDSSLDISWKQQLAQAAAPLYQKAVPWTFANNGNFKVIIDNLAYLFSPTAFNMTDTAVVRLNRPMFNCTYANLLVFYRGDLQKGVWDAHPDRGDRAVENLRKLAELCHAQGLNFFLLVPPDKSFLYRDWVVHPFYRPSSTLAMLREKATPYGYVDLGLLFHQKLEEGSKDLYLPDDEHWTYSAAAMAAETLEKAGAGPAGRTGP